MNHPLNTLRHYVTGAIERGESVAIVEIPAKRPRLTSAQIKALKAYEFAERQEDRYMGSVFVTAAGQRDYEAKTRAAYEACKALGMDHTHGL